jgi:hypothetical protein
MAFLKALPLGAFLTWILALFIGSGGSTGGSLAIHRLAIADYSVFWSWPLFAVATGLAFGILTLMK